MLDGDYCRDEMSTNFFLEHTYIYYSYIQCSKKHFETRVKSTISKMNTVH